MEPWIFAELPLAPSVIGVIGGVLIRSFVRLKGVGHVLVAPGLGVLQVTGAVSEAREVLIHKFVLYGYKGLDGTTNLDLAYWPGLVTA